MVKLRFKSCAKSLFQKSYLPYDFQTVFQMIPWLAIRWRQKPWLGLLLTRLKNIVPFSSGQCMRSQKDKQSVDDANNAGNAKPKNNQKWKISRRYSGWRSQSPLRRWRGKISLILRRLTAFVFILQPLQLSKKRAPRRSSYRADILTKSLELAA